MSIAAAPVRSAFAQAPKRIPIPEGEFTPQPIAIPNFVAGTPGDAEVGVGVAQVITNNLKRSGLFAPIDPAAFIERIVDSDKAPQFNSWKQISAPVMWVEGDQTDTDKWWNGRYSKPEFHERLKAVTRYETHLLSPAGHMLHHDQPEALARLLETFLAG